MPMGYNPPPPPTERLPTLPMQSEDGHPFIDESSAQRLLALAANGTPEELAQHFSRGSSYSLLGAIDPATGDSVLHRAAAVGNLRSMSAIQSTFGPNMGHQRGQERRYWLFMVHQNLAGDTALHAGARAGNLEGVRAVYRMFHQLEASDDTISGPGSEEPSAEFWSTGDFPDDPFFLTPALVFVCTKNQAGRDAAAEATEAGHPEITQWLNDLKQRLDPDGKRQDEGYLRQARQEVLNSLKYLDRSEDARLPS
jgi:hypothetical protein